MSKIRRREVYDALEAERLYQISEGKADERDPDEWLDSIEHYVREACQGEFYRSPSHMLVSLRKVGALVVATLEQYGVPPREGFHASEEWVSVDESLPAINMTVLVYIPGLIDDEYEIAWRFEDYDEKVEWTTRFGYIYGGITHWRALPEPPKKQETE